MSEVMMRRRRIKLSQYNMKKIFAILSLICGLFCGGCSEFELVELENPALDAALEAYAIESSEVDNYLFNEVFLAPYFFQSSQGYFGSYDLRLQVYAKTKGREVDVVGANISQLDRETAIQVNLRAEYLDSSSGLYYEHELLISEINGTELYEAGSEGRTVDVTITAQIGEETKTFEYSFSAKKSKVAVPIH